MPDELTGDRASPGIAAGPAAGVAPSPPPNCRRDDPAERTPSRGEAGGRGARLGRRRAAPPGRRRGPPRPETAEILRAEAMMADDPELADAAARPPATG